MNELQDKSGLVYSFIFKTKSNKITLLASEGPLGGNKGRWRSVEVVETRASRNLTDVPGGTLEKPEWRILNLGNTQ